MLVIQIALGIVLGFVILKNFEPIVRFSIKAAKWIGIALIVAAIIGGVIYSFYNQEETIPKIVTRIVYVVLVVVIISILKIIFNIAIEFIKNIALRNDIFYNSTYLICVAFRLLARLSIGIALAGAFMFITLVDGGYLSKSITEKIVRGLLAVLSICLSLYFTRNSFFLPEIYVGGWIGQKRNIIGYLAVAFVVFIFILMLFEKKSNDVISKIKPHYSVDNVITASGRWVEVDEPEPDKPIMHGASSQYINNKTIIGSGQELKNYLQKKSDEKDNIFSKELEKCEIIQSTNKNKISCYYDLYKSYDNTLNNKYINIIRKLSEQERITLKLDEIKWIKQKEDVCGQYKTKSISYIKEINTLKDFKCQTS